MGIKSGENQLFIDLDINIQMQAKLSRNTAACIVKEKSPADRAI